MGSARKIETFSVTFSANSIKTTTLNVAARSKDEAAHRGSEAYRSMHVKTPQGVEVRVH